MLKRPHYIALALVVVTTLIILNLPSQAASRLKLAIGSVFLPLFGLASSSQELAGDTANAVLPRSALLRENEALRIENQKLKLQVLQAEEVTRQNDRLRTLLAWQKTAPWKLKLANVVVRDPANWWRSVWIDSGHRDGIRTNLPVLTTDGLVGRIEEVGMTRSRVILLGDPNCRVSALVQETGDTGMIGSSGIFDGSLIELSHLSKDANLKAGQTVITSGLGGVFPRGLPVGRIVDSRPVDNGLLTEARVKLAADVSALTEVWILTP